MRLDITVLAALTTLAGACGEVSEPVGMAGVTHVEPAPVVASANLSQAPVITVDASTSVAPVAPVTVEPVLSEIEIEIDEVLEEEIEAEIEAEIEVLEAAVEESPGVAPKVEHSVDHCPPCGRG